MNERGRRSNRYVICFGCCCEKQNIVLKNMFLKAIRGRILSFGEVPEWASSKVDTGGVSEVREMTPFVKRNLELVAISKFQPPFSFLFWEELKIIIFGMFGYKYKILI